ncbi:winged helix-turn-helix transcriptional regulator [Ruania alkalisoli]|uniref:Winged helix-turn-helix transcriptional regulator n=1 Tax=Ruania alkalisoli TaxID=2779775 RepID=A0A7M1SXE6_9MICO|nr:metalloregulator ArsR/SmtB family transcription factor [Ruania alkalisoli]QOR72181.1 winged helix-turn-helix transcriptional regulator [Ruania alkalisoli]
MGAAPDPRLDGALRALADANRRTILDSIRAHPRAVGAIADAVGLSQQTTSHHLGVLREAGLASVQREGTRHLYVVSTDGLAAVKSYLDDFWPQQLSALKAAVEGRGEAPRG